MSRKAVVICAMLGWLACGAAASADQANLLLGTWAVDLSKLNIPNPPRSVTIVFSEAGAGQYKMIVDIVDHDGSKRHGVSTFRPDGTPSPATGNADYDIVSMTMPNRRVLVMGGGFQGHPANTRVFSLSDDLKHMVETVVSHTPAGVPQTRVDIWNRSK